MSNLSDQLGLAAIRVVSFDVWRTLIKPNKGYKTLRIDSLRVCLGLPAERVHEVATIVGAVDKDLNNQTRATGVQYGTRDRLVLIARHFGVEPTDDWVRDTTRVLREHFSAKPPLLTEPGLPEVLRSIRSSGRQIVCISNTGFTDGKHVRVGLAALGLLPLLDEAIFSDEFGHAKPSPEIFARAGELTGVPAGSILHVGDDYAADYAGAINNGLQAVHLSIEPCSGVVSVATIATLAEALSAHSVMA